MKERPLVGFSSVVFDLVFPGFLWGWWKLWIFFSIENSMKKHIKNVQEFIPHAPSPAPLYKYSNPICESHLPMFPFWYANTCSLNWANHLQKVIPHTNVHTWPLWNCLGESLNFMSMFWYGASSVESLHVDGGYKKLIFRMCHCICCENIVKDVDSFILSSFGKYLSTCLCAREALEELRL